MRARLAAAGAMLVVGATPARAHRLDEYLEATTIAVEKGRVRAELRLTPGVAVAPAVLAAIDADGDGVLSVAEQRAYAGRVLGDLSLAVDGDRLRPRLVSWQFAPIQEMREGRGEIRLAVEADVPPGGRSRRLVFENRHQRAIAAYLVNGLVPRDPDLRVTAQRRDYEQSSYRMDYEQAGAPAGPLSAVWSSGARGWLAAAALLPLAWLLALRQRPGPDPRVAPGGGTPDVR